MGVYTGILVFVLGIPVVAGQAPTPAAAPPGFGSITGRVLYRGQVPPPLIVFEGGVKQHVLEVEPSGTGLRFAVVYLDAQPEPTPRDLPVVSVDQVGWTFRPPVIAVSESQPVRFTNSDGANHSIRSRDEVPANQINEFMVAGPYVKRFVRKPDVGHPVLLTCDLHAWMTAWVYVFDHRYHTVTDRGGRFEIKSVPEGFHRLHVRHPGGGLEKDLDVQIAAGRPVLVEVAFDSSDLRLPAPAGGRVVSPVEPKSQ